jgi:hypothetical protein
VFLAEDEFAPGVDFERHSAYLDRCRRVRLGPAVVVFENGRTLRFRLQELAQLARHVGSDRVRRELAWYQSLLPGRNRLLASVSLRDRGANADSRHGRIELQCRNHAIPGRFLAHAAGDRIIGLVRWAEFRFTEADLDVLADQSQPLELVHDTPGLRHAAEVDPAVRDSLLNDLGEISRGLLSSAAPVLQREAGHLGEVAGITGYQDETAR